MDSQEEWASWMFTSQKRQDTIDVQSNAQYQAAQSLFDQQARVAKEMERNLVRLREMTLALFYLQQSIGMRE